MEKRRATLKDIAAAVGVHVSTVSRALDPKSRSLITDTLVERILATAAALDYRPNAVAYSLRTRRSHSIGVLVPDIANPIFPPLLRGLEDILVPQNYAPLVVNTDDDRVKAAAAMDRLQGRGVDGMVIASAERRDSTLAVALAEQLPMVAVNRTSEHPALSAILHDEAGGMAALIDHLASLGHRSIVHLAGPGVLSTGVSRREAFLERLAGQGLDASRDRVVESIGFTESEGRRCAFVLLDRDDPPTAIVAANDHLALGAIAALGERGLSCPTDVSVTGFNDMPFVDRLPPPLTTVRIRAYESGRRAALMLLGLMETPAAARTQQIETLPVDLVIRESTGKVPVQEKSARHKRPKRVSLSRLRG